MTATTVTTARSQQTYDRAALRVELEATRAAFRTLVESVSEERWRQKSPASAWTVAEVMVHLTWALEQLPAEVASARRGMGMFNYPARLSDFLSYWMTRWNARGATPTAVVRQYDAAMTAVIRTLEEVAESDWMQGAAFYGHGFYTIGDLFHTPAQHFAEHTAGL